MCHHGEQAERLQELGVAHVVEVAVCPGAEVRLPEGHLQPPPVHPAAMPGR